MIDVYPDARAVAGAPLHVAAHLSKLGWCARMITRLGRDPEGDLIRATLERHGVDVSLVETDEELATGTVTIHMSGTSHRFEIHKPAAWDAIQGPAGLPPHEVFLYGTLAARCETSRATMLRLLDGDCSMRVFDANLRPPDIDVALVRHALSMATVCKVNDEELIDVAGMLGIAVTPQALFEVALALEWLCVTKGASGAELFDRSGASFSARAPEVEIIDSVGAGDAFVAGLIDGLAQRLPPQEALEHALSTATSVLTTRGGLPSL
ncbi:MAG: hypothetical protein H0V97_11320 [Actinobacteria bacterium]|nr:hypothetical protein [Actinomycetota bacterium]